MSEEQLTDLQGDLFEDYSESFDNELNFFNNSTSDLIDLEALEEIEKNFLVSGRGTVSDHLEPQPSTSGYVHPERRTTAGDINSDSSSDDDDDENSRNISSKFPYDDREILAHHLQQLEENSEKFKRNQNNEREVASVNLNLFENDELKKIVKNFKYIKILNFKTEATFRKVLQKDFCRMRLINTNCAKNFAFAMQELCVLIRTAYNENDMIGIRLKCAESVSDEGIFITLRNPSQFSVALILNNFTRVAQSARQFYATDNLEVFIDCIHTLAGGRRKNLNRPTLDVISEMIRKKSIIVSNLFKTTDGKINDCLFIAIAIGILINNGRWPPRGYRVQIVDGNFLTSKKCNNTKQFIKLIDNEVDFILNAINGSRSGFQDQNFPDRNEIELIQNLLKCYKFSGHPLERQKAKVFAYRIVIFSLNGDTLYVGDLSRVDIPIKTINLLLVDQHYHFISSITGCFAKSYYCQECFKVFNDFSSHKKCPFRCDKCLEQKPCKVSFLGSMTACKECNRSFYGNHCFQKHKKNNICLKIRFCSICNALLKKNHECFKFYCDSCEDLKERGHICMIPAYKPPKFNVKEHIYIFYDIETRLHATDEILMGSNEFNHEPYLIVAQNACDICKSIESSSYICKNCGTREHIFLTDETNNSDCVLDFLNYCIAMGEGCRVTCTAHNSASFDLVLLSKKIFSSKFSKPPKIVLKGLKIILLEWGSIRFVDSLSFLGTSLKNLPSMLGLDSNMTKGYFPYRFFTAKTTGYVGKIPDKEYFDCWNMKAEDLEEFERWYQETSMHEYNLMENLITYCRNDCTILRLAVLKFIKACLKDIGINPLQESITLASYANKVFRYKFYENNISITPAVSYRLTQNQSEIAIKYLYYMSHKLNLDIQSAYNGKEKVVAVGNKQYLVDGFAIDASGNELVFEFSGCLWHSHSHLDRCRLGGNFLANKSNHFLPDESLRAERTERKLADLRKKFKVYHIYECEFLEMMKNDVQIAPLVKQINLNYIKIRDVLKGGWCETIRTYHSVKSDEKIVYLDYTSMYPHLIATRPLPIFGHVKIYIGSECSQLDLTTIDGIIKCDLLPPKNVLYPVLAVKISGKLFFPLCFSCASDQSDTFCDHADIDRIISGTWTTAEIKVAVRQGYQLLNIHEIIQFQMKEGLFKKYVDHYFTLKLYNSGYPPGYDANNIDEFVKEYHKQHSIMLDPQKFTNNPSLRSLSKLLLNCAWGKFAERTRVKQKIIKESAEVLDIVYDKSKTINSMVILNENALLMSYDDAEEKAINTTNIVLAAFVTAYGRIKTIELAEIFGFSACYADTDAVVGIQRESDQHKFKLGSDLGDLSNELEKFGNNAYIRKFVSTGCKSYCAEVFNPDENKQKYILKIKGVTLNMANTSVIDFEKMKEMLEIPNELEEDVEKEEERNRPLIVRDVGFKRRIDGTILTHERKKIFKVTLCKRFRVKNFTFPFGFSQEIAENIIKTEEEERE